MATESRGALGLRIPNAQRQIPLAPLRWPVPTRTLEPWNPDCRCAGAQARLLEALWILSLLDPRTPAWERLQAPGSCPAALALSTTGPCASPTTWRARSLGLDCTRETGSWLKVCPLTLARALSLIQKVPNGFAQIQALPLKSLAHVLHH